MKPLRIPSGWLVAFVSLWIIADTHTALKMPEVSSSAFREFSFDPEQVECLAMNIYYEARGESILGMSAVANVTINRLLHKNYPKTLCEVVYQPFQFSWTRRADLPGLPPDYHARLARLIAMEALEATVEGGTWVLPRSVLWFHAIYISKPNWAKSKEEVAQIGRHIFYK